MRTVLVAEDDDGMRAMLQEALEQAGYKVTAVADGAKAWEKLKAGKTELAVLDLNMPGLDGLEVCRNIRKASLPIAVLMLTVKSKVEEQIKGYDTGADDYLTKPFAPDVLVARLKALERRILEKA